MTDQEWAASDAGKLRLALGQAPEASMKCMSFREAWRIRSQLTPAHRRRVTFLYPGGHFLGSAPCEEEIQMTSTEFLAHVVKLLAEQEMPFSVLAATPQRRVIRPASPESVAHEEALAYRAAYKADLEELLNDEPLPLASGTLCVLCIEAGCRIAEGDKEKLQLTFTSDADDGFSDTPNLTRATLEFLTTLAETAHFGAIDDEPATVTVSAEDYHGELLDRLAKSWQEKPVDKQVHSARAAAGRILLLRSLMPKELQYIDSFGSDCLGMTFDERFTLALHTYRRMLRTYMQE